MIFYTTIKKNQNQQSQINLKGNSKKVKTTRAVANTVFEIYH